MEAPRVAPKAHAPLPVTVGSALQNRPPPQKRLVKLTSRNAFIVHFFNASADYTGFQRQLLPAPIPACDLFRALEKDHPGICRVLRNDCLICVNLGSVDTIEELVRNPQIIFPGDHVALIPVCGLDPEIKPLRRIVGGVVNRKQ